VGVLGRMRGWTARWGLLAVGAVAAAGAIAPLVKPAAAVTDTEVTTLKQVALSRVGLAQRLRALDDLKAIDSTAAAAALAEIAEGKDIRVSAAACAQLGRMKSSGSKSALKGLLEDTGARSDVRNAAAAAIAIHWKDEDDLDYLEEKSEGDAKLSPFVGMLKSRVYGK
jgi:hypothetical protein